jgi:peptidyl-prolyl cis-trans isomerase SurA
MRKLAILGLLSICAAAMPAQEKARVIEEIVARVNNEIITLSDYQRAKIQVAQEVEQDCREQNCAAEQRQRMMEEKQKNVLSDLINQTLLVQRAKDLGITVQPQLIRRLDEIRQQNNLPDMEALQEAVAASGVAYEEWEASLRNGLLTQELVRREVRPYISQDEVKAYYEAHKEKFNRAERVFLSELFFTTEGKTPEEVPAIEEKAKKMLERVRVGGEQFNELAKRYSDGSTAPEGGFLGGEGFARTELDPEIAERVFKLNRGEVTDIIRTKNGFLILKVEQRYEAGTQPLEKVEHEIMNVLYQEKIRPAVQDYLKKLRADSYILVKPGYTDTAGVESLQILEIAAATAEQEETKKKRKKFLWIF